MTIHETAAKLAAVNARIGAMAQTSNAECIRLTARIQELEGALRDAEFLLRQVGINWKESGSMKDSCLRCATDASAILSKGN